MLRTAMLGSIFLVGIVAATIGAAAAAGDTSDDAAKKLVGMWRLVSITTGGQVNSDRGSHPKGFIVYDQSGNMIVQIMPDHDRPRFAGSQPTPEEAKLAILGYTAYFGTYTVDPQAHTVTHHRLGNLQTNEPVDAVRRYEFIGDDRVALTPLGSSTTLTWERIR